jgi:hypothetical protein
MGFARQSRPAFPATTSRFPATTSNDTSYEPLDWA